MIFGIVRGTVVSSTKNDSLQGTKYLLVNTCNQRAETKGEYLVALDAVGAGQGELVIVSQGSSCRQTQWTKQKPIDALIVGIVDLVEEKGAVSFKK